MNSADLFFDRSIRMWVIVQGDSRKEFTPEEFRVICMAANEHMEAALYAYRRRDELRDEQKCSR